jgi:ankyrin repeat protein
MSDSENIKITKNEVTDEKTIVVEEEEKEKIKPKHTLESLTLEIAKYLESNHEHITFQDKLRQLKTVLMLCSKNGDLKTAKIMLSNNVDVNTHDYDGLTPLITAIINHNTDMVRLLLEYNADTNICDNDGWSPLMISIANNENKVTQDNTEIIKMLLENKADISQKNDNGYTPMIISAMNGEMDIMKMLVDRNANVNEKDNEDITVFAHAVMFAGRNSKSEEGNLKNVMIDYLIEKKADIHCSNINNQSALFLSAHNGYYDMVKYCVEHGISYLQRDVNGVNPMEQAYGRGYKEIANYLANKIAS